MIMDIYVDSLIENVPKDNIPKEIDLVLDGGAFNAGYLLGALIYLKALEKKKMITVKRISGCSIGAIIGLCYLFDELKHCVGMYTECISDLRSTQDFTRTKEKFKQMLEEKLATENVENINDVFFLTYFDVVKKNQEVVSQFEDTDDLINKLLKTIHLPFVLDRNITDSDGSIDGGFPYIFKERYDDRKIIFVNLSSFDKITHMISIRNERNIQPRLLNGILDIHTFFSQKCSTKMCSYVNDWGVVDFIKFRSRELLWTTILFLINIFLFIKKYVPKGIVQSIWFNKISSIIGHMYTDIMIYITV